jgi:hypothetical protein
MDRRPKTSFKISHRMLLLHLPMIILYCLVLFGFYFQIQLPPNFKFFYPVSFVTIYILFIYLTPKLIHRMKVSITLIPFATIGFVLANSTALYFLSSIKRESEIQNYIANNQDKLKSVIYLQQNPRTEQVIDPILNELNICSFFKHTEDYYFKLYYFLGYGYGLIYTDKSEMAIPKTSPGGSPIIKWIKIDEHWYYYSYFD